MTINKSTFREVEDMVTKCLQEDFAHVSQAETRRLVDSLYSNQQGLITANIVLMLMRTNNLISPPEHTLLLKKAADGRLTPSEKFVIYYYENTFAETPNA
jgi:hypothetical protein